MTARLTIISGPDTGRSCDLLAGNVLVVGRGTTCGLRLADPSVSRVHCRLTIEAGRVRLDDAGSSFGTHINGLPVSSHELEPGDIISLGDTELRYESTVRQRATALPKGFSSSDDEPDEDAPPGASGTPLRDVSHLVGEKFLRYDVQSVVARATSGIVYRAVDTKSGQPVALKLFWPQLFSDERAMARFLRSMKVIVPLQHANLVKVYAAGKSRGACFTASEFIDGESAAQLIQRIGVAGMLDWRNTWRMAVALAEALEHIHEHNILHRSLRPNNILIRRADQCVKLGDSVLAKALDQIGQAALSSRTDIVGDVYYLSPEQVSGGVHVDGRADIYSLGATLYALLTGRPPFVGHPTQVVGQILAQPPVPPTKVHLAIPPLFEGVVLRMMAKRPEERFTNASQLLAELRRVGKYAGVE